MLILPLLLGREFKREAVREVRSCGEDVELKFLQQVFGTLGRSLKKQKSWIQQQALTRTPTSSRMTPLEKTVSR